MVSLVCKDSDWQGFEYSHSRKFVFEEVTGNINHKISEEPDSQNKNTKELNENENEESHKDLQIMIGVHESISHGQQNLLLERSKAASSAFEDYDWQGFTYSYATRLIHQEVINKSNP